MLFEIFFIEHLINKSMLCVVLSDLINNSKLKTSQARSGLIFDHFAQLLQQIRRNRGPELAMGVPGSGYRKIRRTPAWGSRVCYDTCLIFPYFVSPTGTASSADPTPQNASKMQQILKPPKAPKSCPKWCPKGVNKFRKGSSFV